MSECSAMGGAVNGEPSDDERVKCHLDFCLEEGSKSGYYDFPHTNVQFDTDSTHEYEIDTICVNECEGAIAALTDATANVAVKFYDEQGQQVSLHCDA